MEHERRAEQRAERQPKKRRGSVAGKIFGVLFTLLLIGVCTGGMLFGIFMKYVDTTLAPTLAVDVDSYILNLSSFIYYQDKETEEWVEFQTVHGTENRVLAEYSELPENLLNAAVAIEDERFYQHQGVDWKRTLGATWNFFTHDRDTFGGSTITQQVLKNMTKDKEGTVNRKIREIFRALKFEESTSKESILTMYLNYIYLGQGCYGVKTASEFYFGKDVSELSLAECASLIAITNNPSLYGPMYDITYTREDGTKITPRELNKQRQEDILDKMAEVGRDGKAEDGATPFITKEEAEAAKAEVLQFRNDGATAEELVEKKVGGIEVNSWFVDQVIEDVSQDLAEQMHITQDKAIVLINNRGYHIYTTLDPEIQSIAESVYEDRGNLDVTSRSGQQLQSGITILDPYTGNIVATVGRIGEKTGNRLWSFATTTKRQPGSSIKPLTCYAPAIDAGVVTPATVFDNYPVMEMNGTPWPKNSPNTYTGFTTVAEGVRKSINTIAVQTVQKVGLAEAYAFATEKLCLSLDPADLGLSPLGMGGLTYGLNTVEMAAAYACFANQGIYNEPRTYLRVTQVEKDGTETVVLENESESHVAMKDTTAYLMNQMLKEAVNSGTGASAKFSGMTIAGKTGTTSDNNDRYFVGYTPYYVAAVWTGYEKPERISYNGNPAITMWKKVMQQIHEDLPNKGFLEPSGGLETVEICLDSGLKPTDACRADVRGGRVKSMVVAAGTGPTESCTTHVMVDYCTEGKCLATESCPPGSVTQVGVLDYVRADYGESIKADDDPYLLVNMEKALEPQAPTAENPVGTAGGCPVHAGMAVDPNEGLDPSDPNYDPALDPNSPNYDPSLNPNDPDVPPVTDPGTTVPAEPQEPDPPVTDPGGGDNWVDNLWGNH